MCCIRSCARPTICCSAGTIEHILRTENPRFVGITRCEQIKPESWNTWTFLQRKPSGDCSLDIVTKSEVSLIQWPAADFHDRSSSSVTSATRGIGSRGVSFAAASRLSKQPSMACCIHSTSSRVIPDLRQPLRCQPTSRCADRAIRQVKTIISVSEKVSAAAGYSGLVVTSSDPYVTA